MTIMNISFEVDQSRDIAPRDNLPHKVLLDGVEFKFRGRYTIRLLTTNPHSSPVKYYLCLHYYGLSRSGLTWYPLFNNYYTLRTWSRILDRVSRGEEIGYRLI